MQNRNLKLGLCGLALTSFLALNAHSVVHADTVSDNNANNNEITWDSDSDDSQVVKNEPQQPQVSQTVQKQAPVQSNVQVKQTQPVQKKVMVSSVSSSPSSQSVQNRAEKSIVRQSNVETSTVNRLNADNQHSYANVKVAHLDATAHSQGTNVDISANPMEGDNAITVHYVDMHGRNIKGVDDDTIWNITYPTIDNTPYNPDGIASGQYKVPNGYQLLNPKGTYSWINYPTKFATRQWAFPTETSTDSRYFSDSDAIEKLNAVNGAPAQAEINNANKILATLGDSAMKASPDAVGDSINNLDKNHDCVRVTTDTHDGVRYIAFDIAHPDRSYGDGNNRYYEFMENGDIDIGYTQISNTKFDTSGFDTLYNFIAKYANECIINTYTQLDDWRFKDNSGNARQGATATTVNVTLVKSVPVNDASQTRKTAQRVISVNLPNDQGARKRYEGLLNSNNQIVQTLTFTRSMTKDDLTGAVLSQSAWQGPSSFPAVTLPDIPGYTMTMN